MQLLRAVLRGRFLLPCPVCETGEAWRKQPGASRGICAEVLGTGNSATERGLVALRASDSALTEQRRKSFLSATSAPSTATRAISNVSMGISGPLRGE